MKGQIKICEKNIAALQAAIDAAEGRAAQRTVPAAYLLTLAQRVESETALAHLPKADHTGATVEYRMGLDLPNSYQYRPEYTHIQIVRRASGWFLDGVHRLPGSNKQAEHLGLRVSKGQDEAIISRLRGTYTVSARSE